jgi:hypothetical protein
VQWRSGAACLQAVCSCESSRKSHLAEVTEFCVVHLQDVYVLEAQPREALLESLCDRLRRKFKVLCTVSAHLCGDNDLVPWQAHECLAQDSF